MNKPWLSLYPDDVSDSIDLTQYTSLVEMFEQSVHRYADQPAFINMGTMMTFRKLEERSRAFAAYLQNELGLKKGDRVALMMPNLLQYPIALFGVLRAGMIVVNVNPLYTPYELEHQLNDSGAKAIVVVSNCAHTLEKVIDKTVIKHVLLTSVGQLMPRAKGTVIDWVVKYVKRMVPKFHLSKTVSFRKALRKGRRMQYVKPRMSGDDVACLQYTGGTTGVAKGAMLTHRNLLANVLQAKSMYHPMLSEGKECVVTALPMYHIFALTINCLLFIEMGGCNVLITNPRDVPAFIKELKRYPVTAITGINTLFNMLVNNEDFREIDFSTWRIAVGGGASVQRSVAEQWKKITGIHLLEGYGLTECAPLVAGTPYNSKDYLASIGLPVPSTDIRFVDDDGNVLPFDETGELQVRGPQVMAGYWQRPEATKEVLDEDGWLSTGDIVKFGEGGLLHLVDRKKNMILVSGFNVYPNEIEDVVALHDKVLEVAAIGQPHEVSGERIKIYVVKSDPSLTKDEIIKHCREYLTGYKIPKLIEFKDELPKSNIGKVLHRVLRDENEAMLAKNSNANSLQ